MFLMYKLDSCQPPPTQCIVKVLFGGKTAAVLYIDVRVGRSIMLNW